MRLARLTLSPLAALALLLAAGVALACPFCSAPSLTLSEQVSQADAVLIIKWVKGQKPKVASAVGAATGDVAIPAASSTGGGTASTTFEVADVVKGGKGVPAKGETLTLAGYTPGEAGESFLLLGTRFTTVEWGLPMAVEPTSVAYLKGLPTPDKPAQERLKYFLKYLESPDRIVAADAYGEFANADYKDIAAMADQMPHAKLREWVTQAQGDTAARLGLYGLMLGLSGTPEDAQAMERLITQSSDDYRLGIDGIMSGYLLLTGEKGLDVLDRTKLSKKSGASFSETYAAMQALRFMWTYGDERIKHERLRKSMRGLLDRPELADLVIADLARWQDWSVSDRLMDLFDAEGYDLPPIKRAIVKYFLVEAEARDKDLDGNAAPHVAEAKKHLAELRAKDPDTVHNAERFFIR